MSEPRVHAVDFDRAAIRGFQIAAHRGGSANGAKTQFRLVAFDKDPAAIDHEDLGDGHGRALWGEWRALEAPYRSGDLLYIREPLQIAPDYDCVQYQADLNIIPGERWDAVNHRIPAARCPRRLTRYAARVLSVHLEPLRSITPESAIAEGLHCLSKDRQTWKYGIADRDGWPHGDGWAWRDWHVDPVEAYGKRWFRELHSECGRNPLVWVYRFEPFPEPVSTVLSSPQRYGAAVAASNQEQQP